MDIVRIRNFLCFLERICILFFKAQILFDEISDILRFFRFPFQKAQESFFAEGGGGVDFVIIRCISDNASGEAEMEYPEMVKIAAVKSQQLVEAILERI